MSNTPKKQRELALYTRMRSIHGESGRLPSECSAGPGEAHIDWSGPYSRVDPGIVKGGGGDMVPYKATENFGLYVQFPAIWEICSEACIALTHACMKSHRRVFRVQHDYAFRRSSLARCALTSSGGT